MRTTFDIKDDLMRKIGLISRSTHKTLKVVVNELLTQSLEPVKPGRQPWTARTHAMGRPLYDLGKALSLADQFEAEAVAEKLELSK